MSEVKAFHLAGIYMWIPSGDHSPPHFHARKPGHWKIVVLIQESEGNMIKTIEPPDARIKGKERRAIIQNVIQHRVALLEEWEANQGKD